MKKIISLTNIPLNTLHVACEILSYFTTYTYNILSASYTLITTHSTSLVPMCAKKTKIKIQNLTIHCATHLIQLVLYNLYSINQDALKAMKVSHPTNINLLVNYSAVLKCQANFRFKVKNDNTVALKYIYLIY